MFEEVWNNKLTFRLLRHWHGVTLEEHIVAVLDNEAEGEHYLKAVRFLNSNDIPHGLLNTNWMVKAAELATVLNIEERDEYISTTRAARLITEKAHAQT